MTNVISSAAPPAQPMTAESSDPPTIKNAGRLHYEGEVFGIVFATLVFGLLAVGALLQAVMTNQGRGVRGLGLNALAGFAALGALATIVASSGELSDWSSWLFLVVPWATIWVVGAVLAFAVGSLVGARPRA